MPPPPIEKIIDQFQNWKLCIIHKLLFLHSQPIFKTNSRAEQVKFSSCIVYTCGPAIGLPPKTTTYLGRRPLAKLSHICTFPLRPVEIARFDQHLRRMKLSRLLIDYWNYPLTITYNFRTNKLSILHRYLNVHLIRLWLMRDIPTTSLTVGLKVSPLLVSWSVLLCCGITAA